ncbi:LysR substrate-binding domain-containing protein [Cognatishimia sp. F0-27]|uniref:LysR substrate-binding domain-containing protein n=1 Tax=Cognatishimia sp. F0-27 TaxID=2816855 RepID=UPI001D0C7F13|nr:LysR substrate-binding domain-containing protein [Cognatishimia sp. F0-27]MCC1492658.1 LysR family transcriptional regulator [Cognatishimia sp. F0-27]
MKEPLSLARRTLPPLPALRALEALDRLGSATAVAEELDLTQSAVSRQLKTLEAQLGVTLFLRDRRALRLTPQARDFAATCRDALDRIAQGALALRLDPSGGALHLAILPSFGMRWLVPRLPDFARRHPDVTVNMTTKLRPFAFADAPYDAAIHFGSPDAWPGTRHLRLMPERVRPLAARALLPDGPVSLEALARLPLLHIQTRPDAWKTWFTAQGVDPGPLPGTSFDQFTTILQAAIHGLGIALLPDYLSETDRASGALVPAADSAPMTLGAYHLIWPDDRPASAALTAFRDWLALITEDEDALPR